MGSLPTAEAVRERRAVLRPLAAPRRRRCGVRCAHRGALAFGLALALPFGPAAAEPPPEALAEELARTQRELASTQEELAATRAALSELTRRVDGLAAAPVAPGGAAVVAPTARLAPVNADNPAISFAVDALAVADTRDEDGVGFQLQSGELAISGPIDPFLRGYATIAASTEEGFGLEEAALVTTALPWNLNVRGGRFFADVGRLSSFHPEQLPFANRPPSLERLIGGESQAEGVELSWLAPIGPFFELTLGAYNAVGAERIEEPDEFGVDFGRRTWSELTYLARPLTYFDLTDTFSAEIGGTYLFIPRDSNRNLYGVDVTLRHFPGFAGFYQGTTVGVEWLWNDERFRDVVELLDPLSGEPLVGEEGEPLFGPGRFVRTGGYAYFESFFARGFSGGARFDYSEAVAGAEDPLRTTSLFVTWMPSEFQRLRFQFDNALGNERDDQRYTLQWTAFIGSHAHGFRTRAR